MELICTEQQLKTFHNMFTFPTTQFGSSHDPGTLKTSLVAAWECNEGSGNLTDAHTTNNDLDDYGTPAYGNTGKLGDSIGFDGSTDYFRETTSSNLYTPASAASYSCWFKSDGNTGTSSRMLMGKYYSNTGNRVMIMSIVGSGHATVPNRITLQTYDSANVSNPCPYNAGGSDIYTDIWNHVVGVRDGDTNYLYLNGELVNSNTSGNGSGRQSTTSYAWFAVGATAKSTSIPDLFFNGDLDQSCVWSKALTETEIRFLYSQGSGVPYSAWG